MDRSISAAGPVPGQGVTTLLLRPTRWSSLSQNKGLDTSQPAVTDAVSVVLTELADEMRKDCWLLPSGPGW